MDLWRTTGGRPLPGPATRTRRTSRVRTLVRSETARSRLGGSLRLGAWVRYTETQAPRVPAPRGEVTTDWSYNWPVPVPDPCQTNHQCTYNVSLSNTLESYTHEVIQDELNFSFLVLRSVPFGDVHSCHLRPRRRTVTPVSQTKPAPLDPCPRGFFSCTLTPPKVDPRHLPGPVGGTPFSTRFPVVRPVSSTLPRDLSCPHPPPPFPVTGVGRPEESGWDLSRVRRPGPNDHRRRTRGWGLSVTGHPGSLVTD